MITLTSKWKLRCGATEELVETLQQLAHDVNAAEEGTWVYSVHLTAAPPLDGDHNPIVPAPDSYPLEQMTDVVYFEVYKDADAFSTHVHGEIFQTYLANNLHHFYEDPDMPGWPRADTTFLDRMSAFFQLEANG